MKHDDLRSIAHNVADSLASGCGLLIGVYMTSIFAETKKCKGGVLKVDFLNGKALSDRPSRSLAGAIGKYRNGLRGLCEKHGGSIADFRELTAEYSETSTGQRIVVVTVEDQKGRRSTDTYADSPLRRVKQLDSSGRIRPKPTARS